MENVVWNIAAILSQPQCVKPNWVMIISIHRNNLNMLFVNDGCIAWDNLHLILNPIYSAWLRAHFLSMAQHGHS